MPVAWRERSAAGRDPPAAALAGSSDSRGIPVPLAGANLAGRGHQRRRARAGRRRRGALVAGGPGPADLRGIPVGPHLGHLPVVGDQGTPGYAFVAGMVASVNPCGFVLLPAY